MEKKQRKGKEKYLIKSVLHEEKREKKKEEKREKRSNT